jgi:hypothetical protein
MARKEFPVSVVAALFVAAVKRKKNGTVPKQGAVDGVAQEA